MAARYAHIAIPALTEAIGDLAHRGDRIRDGFATSAATGFVLAVGVAHYAAVTRRKGSSTAPS